MLIQQRSRNKKHNPLAWTLSVAGHVPSGEGYEEAAHRELKEELGFDINLAPYEKAIFRSPTETQIITSYIGKFIAGTRVIINNDEIEDYKFVTESELEDLNIKDKVENISLNDLRKFFRGKYDEVVNRLNKNETLE